MGEAGVRRLLIGEPLPTAAAAHERLSRPRAIGAFGLDALSSVAYGPDEILYVLVLAGAAGVGWNLPIALAIVALLAIVATSYWQTIFAYPKGGGSYTVARENLGNLAGLVAAAALMVDYLTTVAVSVTAGVAAVVAFVPALDRHRVLADLACIALLILVNLRGVREAGAFFVAPTYLFIGSLAALLGWGLVGVLTHGAPPRLHTVPHPLEAVSIVLVLRAFAGGCTAMTGVEAIANGVPAFKRPEARNAARTLLTLATILAVLFLGVVVLGREVGAIPSDQASVIAEIGRAVAGGGPLFYLVQLSTALVLLLAANTSFNGFPLLAAIMAKDDYLPHQLEHRGLRLAYSNGVLAIGVLAGVLVVLFHGSTHALIPLFAVGVFLCFTLSQAGMVRYWRRVRQPGWQRKLAINGTGAVVTGAVTLVVMATKFTHGAWIVLLLIPLIVLNSLAIHAHYTAVRQEVDLVPPRRQDRAGRRAVIPVRRLNRVVAETVNYATAMNCAMVAVHVAVDEDEAGELERAWAEWASDLPLKIVPSPHRYVVGPLLDEIDRLRQEDPAQPLTVMLPEIVTRNLWEEPLHNTVAVALKLALLYRPGVVVTSVPIRVRR